MDMEESLLGLARSGARNDLGAPPRPPVHRAHARAQRGSVCCELVFRTDPGMNAPGAPTALATPAITRPEDLVGYDLIRRLVGFPTVSRDSNLALIEWIRAYVEELGATTALTFNDDRRKA